MIKAIYKSIISERTRINLIHIGAELTSIFYKGNKLSCNCCERSFNQFKPFGAPPRKNALCPYCLSLERTRVLKFYLEKEIFSKYNELDVLHFAPERSLESFIRQHSYTYISADISNQVADVIVDITKMQFEDDSFDLLICSHVLAHVENEPKAIDEIIRVMKPNGKAVLMTAISDSEVTVEDMTATTPAKKLASLGQNDIWRKHGRDFIQRIKRQSINVVVIDYRDKLGSEITAKYSLGQSSREKLYILEKV